MPADAAQTESALPALMLTERISATSVAEINPIFTPSQIAMKEFGNLTFVLSQTNKLYLVDELGRQAPGFDSINNSLIVDWGSIRTGIDTDSYGTRSTNPNKYSVLANLHYSTNSNTVSIRECPPALQVFLDAYLRKTGRNGLAPIPGNNWRIGDPNQTHQVIITSDCIVFYEEESSCFVAYGTVDQQGQPLPPHKWQRYDYKNLFLDDLPKPIAKQVDNLIKKTESGVKDIKPIHGFNLIVFEDTISAVKSGNPISQTEFTASVPLVKNNVCTDPQDTHVVYYCSTFNATEVFKLRMEGDPSTWKTERIPIPTIYPQIASLQLDPTGNAFMFETGRDVVLVEKNSFKELKRIPLKKAIFDQQGKIRGVDKNGYFVVVESTLEQVAKELQKRQLAQKAAGIDVQSLFQDTPQQAAEKDTATIPDTETLLPIRHQQEANFLKMLTRAQSLEEVTKASEVLQILKAQLSDRGFSDTQTAFLTSGIAQAITLRQRVFAQHEAGKLIRNLEPRIAPTFVSIANMQALRTELNRLNNISGLLTPETRNQVTILNQRFDRQVGELYRREGETIQTDISNRISAITTRLGKMQTRAELNDWRELDLPAIKQDLASLARESPLEAIEVQQRINEARAEIDRVVKSYEDKFRQEYDQIRGKAQEIIAERETLITAEANGFITRMQERGFNTREAAEQFIAASGTRTLLENDIAELSKQNPEGAKILARNLRIQITHLLGQIERASQVKSTGQGELVPFGANGETTFAKWAAKVAKISTKKRVDLVFLANGEILRNGIHPDQIMADIGVKIIDSSGKVRTIRLFEDTPSEMNWRLGLYHKGGLSIPSTIMPKNSFLKLRQDFEDWNKPHSILKTEFVNLRKQLLDHLRSRPRLNQRTEKDLITGRRQAKLDYQDNPVWRQELDTLNQKYIQFVAEHHIMFLDRIDQIQKAPLPESTNGKGLPAKWNTSWTRDEYTEEKLEEIVKYMKMQLDQQKGIIMLKGHAGTGKDVCMAMVSALLERPLFAFNCSKWTTEEDLTEVLLLEAMEGAPRSIKVPSSLLTGIQTEGAMVYLNEFNALPPPTQLFLHSLFDDKRSLMLKIGGKVIKARSTVVLLGSMNEGTLYEGTYPVQPATRSRMTFVNFDYTPLIGRRREGDANPNPPYSSAGALRLAREVKSLEDFTLEEDIERNEFVKIWDQYVNKIDRGADLSKLTPMQKYDLEVILCLVQWGDKLTKAFAKQADGLAKANDLPVMFPLTGREMSSMAYWLSAEIADKDKEEGLIPGKETYEKTARVLLERFFLSKLNDEKQKDAIRKAIQGWTSQKRL